MRRALLLLGLAAGVAGLSSCHFGESSIGGAGSEPLELDFIQLTGGNREIGLEVKGLDQTVAGRLAGTERSAGEWARILAVYVDSPSSLAERPPPIAGTYTITGGRLRFVPRFPLTPGLSYRAVLQVTALEEAVTADNPGGPSRRDAARSATWRQRTVEAKFHVPAPDRGVPTRVARVYPTPSVLPENLLKFYIYFSAPMSQGWAFRHIRLVEAGGTTVADPFLELADELWDKDGRRLTVFLDPGRVKRELRPREDVGPALLEGREYRLVIDREWRDANGFRLAATFAKTFKVAGPDYDALDTRSWNLTAPRSGGRDPLLVEFPEPVDHALARRLLWLNDSRGEQVSGRASLADGERLWRFVPAAAWVAGDYELVADSNLEDLAGNGIGRPFEVDVTGPPAGSSRSSRTPGKRPRVHTLPVTVLERGEAP